MKILFERCGQEKKQLIQHEYDELAFQIHGYLHREEGDVSNANIGITEQEKPSNNTLEQELERSYPLAKSTNN